MAWARNNVTVTRHYLFSYVVNNTLVLLIKQLTKHSCNTADVGYLVLKQTVQVKQLTKVDLRTNLKDTSAYNRLTAITVPKISLQRIHN